MLKPDRFSCSQKIWLKRDPPVPRIARQFWGARDKLSIEEGLLMKGNCICIPPELYVRSLHELHEMHLGTEKMQHRARATVYWPGNRCGHSGICQEMQDMHSAQGNPAHPTNVTKRCTRSPLARPSS